jgi:hypothetical protein
LNDPLTTPSPALQLRRPGRDPTTSSQHRTDDSGELGNARSPAVIFWHRSLRAIAVLNVALWSLAAVAVTRRQDSITGEIYATSCMQLLLSAGYVAGCAYRSFLPVIDIPRIVLVDSRLSSVLVGRSVATVAELCFAAQWALMLHRIGAGNSLFVQAVSLGVVPLILVAEACSWYAVLTRGQRAHAVENSLWGLCAALVVVSMLVIGPHRLASLSTPTIAGGVAYVAFIFFYDVPMYWARWRVDQGNGRRYLSIAEGIAEARRRRVLSYRWVDWRDEIAWMSLYFTFGVWSSIRLVYSSLTLA